MPTRLTVSDWLSLSRIPLAVVFILSFSVDNTFQYIFGLSVAIVALFTDILDGHISRKNRTSSIFGYMLDGLGDKVFYIALFFASVREGFSDVPLAMVLISKEIALYATRSIDVNLETRLKKYRPFSRLSALFVRIYFAFMFLWGGWSWSNEYRLAIDILGNTSGWIAATIGGWGLMLIVRQMWEEAIEQPPKQQE